MPSIVEMLYELASGNLATRIVPAGKDDDLDAVMTGLNMLAEELMASTVSRDFLDSIIGSTPDVLVVLNLDRTIRMINPAAAPLLGYSREEMVGKPIAMLFPEKEEFFEETVWRKFLEDGTVRDRSMICTAKGGEKISVNFSGSVLRDKEGKPVGAVGVAKDMRELLRLQASTAAAEKALLQSEKMAAVGQLAAGVAHEINNPLGVILGFAQSVAKRIEAGDPLELPLKSIEREALRCKQLVQDLLTFSRAGGAGGGPINVNQAIEHSLPLILAQSKVTNVEIKKELAFELPEVLADMNQIQQVIINLCNNAIDAMEGGGVLTIGTRLDTNFVLIEIKDTGTGIAPEIKAKIFEPFFTTKEVGKGTGLGLALVYEIVQKYKGQIHVNSEPGKGAAFVVSLPVKSSPNA